MDCHSVSRASCLAQHANAPGAPGIPDAARAVRLRSEPVRTAPIPAFDSEREVDGESANAAGHYAPSVRRCWRVAFEAVSRGHLCDTELREIASRAMTLVRCLSLLEALRGQWRGRAIGEPATIPPEFTSAACGEADRAVERAHQVALQSAYVASRRALYNGQIDETALVAQVQELLARGHAAAPASDVARSLWRAIVACATDARAEERMLSGLIWPELAAYHAGKPRQGADGR